MTLKLPTKTASTAGIDAVVDAVVDVDVDVGALARCCSTAEGICIAACLW